MAIRRSRPVSALGAGQPGAKQSDLRERNLSLVLRQVLACSEPPSRADVSALTGLTRSTVSRLVDELIGGGMLSELTATGTGRAGRPALPLIPRENALCTLGLELDVSHRSAFVLDLNGRVLASRAIESDHAGSDPVVAMGDLAALAREVLAEADPGRLVGTAVAVPGLVDNARGVLLRAPNLGWTDVAIADVLRSALELPDEVVVIVGNEADFSATTIAMTAPGSPSAMGDFLYISGETGIGSAAVYDAGVAGGRHGWAGELGHVTVKPDGLRCGCGATGCLEAYAGARALCTLAGVPDIASLRAAAQAGDATAIDALSEAGTALGIAVAGALNLLDLPLVVIGGHLSHLADWVLPTMEVQLRERVLAYELAPPDIVVDTSSNPAALGAALEAFTAVLERPVPWLQPLPQPGTDTIQPRRAASEPL